MNRMRQRVRFYSLWGAAAFVIGLLLFQPDTAMGQVTGSGTINKIPKWTATTTLGDSAIAESSNNVGIGTSSPLAQLHITKELRIDGTDASGGYRAIGFGGNALNNNPTIYSNSAYLVVNAKGGSALYLNWDNATGSTNIQGNGGNVGIGTASPTSKLHVVGDVLVKAGGGAAGNITADGNIAAKYQDVAEWVPARHTMPAGTVVTLDPDQSNHVLPSTRSYDTRVAGVVSAKPGVLLGEGGEGKVMVATTGRVRVKVDASNGPIRVGDLLVTSDKEGIAMRSQPLDLGGTPIHRPGTLIGKALEPLDKGTGEILVLLSLQ
jgi:hypothetical protein